MSMQYDELYEGANGEYNADQSGKLFKYNVDYIPIQDNLECNGIVKKFEVNSSQLTIENSLGEGQFGDVFLGTLSRPNGNVRVAVKMPKRHSESNDQQMQRDLLLDEMKTMASLQEKLPNGHENVLKLIGAITTSSDHFCFLTEYCEWGSLNNFLRKKYESEKYINEIVSEDSGSSMLSRKQTYKVQHNSCWAEHFASRREAGFITTSDLLWFALQIARAMQFLSEQKVLHRDVALRNVLIKPDFTLKVADFGLSRKLKNGKDYYLIVQNRTALPVLYFAPESLIYGRYTIKSECWSFGVVIWELFTFAKKTPYLSELNISGRNEFFLSCLMDYLKSGRRLPLPSNIPYRTWVLVNGLWKEDPEQRPSFYACQESLRKELMLSCPNMLKNEQIADPRTSATSLSCLGHTYETHPILNESSNSASLQLEVVEMNGKHMNALHNATLRDFCEDLETEDVLQYLLVKGIVQDRQAEEIFATARKDTRNMKLISAIEVAGPSVVKEFIDALRINNNRFLADKIRPHLPPSSVQQLTSPELSTTVRTSLKDMYLQRFRKTNPFSLPFTFDIESTWVSLVLREDSYHSQATEDHAELLKNAFSKEKMLIIEGKPATGKTSLMRRLAYEWAKGKQELTHFDLIVYAEFREVREKQFESITDLVLQYNKKYNKFIDNKELEELEFLLSNKKYCKEQRVLLLLDGYDESSLDKQCTELSAYLSSSIIQGPVLFNIVLTTRPGYLSKHRGKKGRFLFADVLGFTTKKQKETYISNHFFSTEGIYKKKNVEAVHSLLDENKNLDKLAETPLFLTFICLVHEKIIDGTLLELYCKIVWWLLDRHQKDFPNRNIPYEFQFAVCCEDKFRTIQDNYLQFPQLHCLSKMALVNLKKNAFQESDCQQFNLKPILKQVGLIRKEEFYDQSYRLATTFYFPHRTIQEFLAAFYSFIADECFTPTSRKLNTSLMYEYERFRFRVALSDQLPIKPDKRESYFKRLLELNLDLYFDAFNSPAGFNITLLNKLISQCSNIQSINLNGNHHTALQNNTLLLFNDLIYLHTLTFYECIFQAYSQISFNNCSALKNLSFKKCETRSSATIDFTKLPAINTLEFWNCNFHVFNFSFTNCSSVDFLEFSECDITSGTPLDFVNLPAVNTLTFSKCLFESNSKISFTNCFPLDTLEFHTCNIFGCIALSLATLPYIDTVEFFGCLIDMQAWEAITDEIRKGSVKRLKLCTDYLKNKEDCEFLHHLHNCECIEILEISGINELVITERLSFHDLRNLHTLTFFSCTFEVNSYILYTNCLALKTLEFNKCKIESCVNSGFSKLPAIDTLQFSNCKIDLKAWQLIADEIARSSVKILTLSSDFFTEENNSAFFIHLKKCECLETIKIHILPDKSYEKELITKLSQLAREMMGLKSIIFDCSDESLADKSMEIIEKTGQERDPNFLIKKLDLGIKDVALKEVLF